MLYIYINHALCKQSFRLNPKSITQSKDHIKNLHDKQYLLVIIFIVVTMDEIMRLKGLQTRFEILLSSFWKRRVMLTGSQALFFLTMILVSFLLTRG